MASPTGSPVSDTGSFVSAKSQLMTDDQPKSCFQRFVKVIDSCIDCFVNAIVTVYNCVLGLVIFCVLCCRSIEPVPADQVYMQGSDAESLEGSESEYTEDDETEQEALFVEATPSLRARAVGRLKGWWNWVTRKQAPDEAALPDGVAPLSGDELPSTSTPPPRRRRHFLPMEPASLKHLYPQQYWDDQTGQVMVRGNDYDESTKEPKIPSAPPVFKLEGVQLFYTGDNPVYFVTEYEQSLAAQIFKDEARRNVADEEQREMFVVSFSLYRAAYYTLSITFSASCEEIQALRGTPFGNLWELFKAEGHEGDEFRNNRLKVIPKMTAKPGASWYLTVPLSQAKVPAITARKLNQYYRVEDKCLEICLDASSGIIGRIAQQVMNMSKDMDEVGLNFVIEGKPLGDEQPRQLPERVAAAARLKNPDLSKARKLDLEKKRVLPVPELTEITAGVA